MPTSHRQAVRVALRGLMPEWRVQTVDHVSYLPGGYANDNYRFEYEGGAYALRIARHPGADRRAEALFLQLASAPEVVAFDLPTGHLLTRWIDGALLADSPVPPETAAAYVQALHAEIPSGVRSYDPREAIHRDLAGAGKLARNAVLALERLDWTPAGLGGCHNDLNPWNVLCTERGWRTLDWEFAGDNDPLFDVVCL
ncbi:MAG: phosphotransferase, partial [Gammaproteobacteria bacterium]|nr:phosphotransferase [Gammaproteobacteria bacterium]